MHTLFITGGTGCIGAVTIYKLLQSKEVEKIVVTSRSNNKDTLKLWLGEDLDSRLEFINLDIANYDVIPQLLAMVNPTHIIHLGAFQSPQCSKNHIKGMEINVGGTMALFDAAEKLPNLKKFVFASSAAVYGVRAMYPKPGITEDAQLAPPNHYGVWKLAGEHLARLFYDNTKVPTVCLRINTTYGMGRDRGKTSAPTIALKAIVQGAIDGKTIPFVMPYNGRENYHFVEDVGAHFASCTLAQYTGFDAFNINGETIGIDSFLEHIKVQATELGMAKYVDLSISKNAEPNLFVSDLSHEKINSAFHDLPLTTISEGIRKSLLAFKDIAEQGDLNYSES